ACSASILVAMRRTRKEIFVQDHRGAKAPLFHGNRNGSHARFARGTDEGVRPYTIILAGKRVAHPFSSTTEGPPSLGCLQVGKVQQATLTSCPGQMRRKS